MKRLRVLISAYACEPNKGSEPALGWHMAMEMAKHHDVWVLTRANNKAAIEAWCAQNDDPRPSFVYYDLPNWVLQLKRGLFGIFIYYYLWQIGAYFLAKSEHAKHLFDLSHHVTFAKYWAPSFLAFLPVPFVWGPVGGGESTPSSFVSTFSRYGRFYETMRSLARWAGQWDPFVRLTARRARLSLATTQETANRIQALSPQSLSVLTQCGIGEQAFGSISRTHPLSGARIFISIGNLLHLKGFHLSIMAFAQARCLEAEYWIIGDGPERDRLMALVQSLGLQNQVRFFGRLSQADTLRRLGNADVLIHPSLHESGGFVCLEAMAAGLPVLCLNLGGPGTIVPPEAGIKLEAGTPAQVIQDLSRALLRLATDIQALSCMGQAGRAAVLQRYTWERKGLLMSALYRQVVAHEAASGESISMFQPESVR